MKQLSSFIKVIRANRQAAVGMYLLLILVGFALFGQWLIGDLPADYTNRLLSGIFPEFLQLGTLLDAA